MQTERARKPMKERVELSAQWRSSITSNAGPSCASPSSSGEQRLEDPRLGGLTRAAILPESGEDRVKSGAERGRERVQGRVAVADERAQRCEQRRVGELVLAQLHAVTG